MGRTGASYITADSPGVAVWKIPPVTKYVNGGTMTVDHTGRVYVLVRGEEGCRFTSSEIRQPNEGRATFCM